VVPLVAFAAVDRSMRDAVCEGFDTPVRAAWNDGVRRGLDSRFGAASASWALPAWRTLSNRLDETAAQWTTRRVAVCELVEHSDLGERQAGALPGGVERAGQTRVEAVEAADRVDCGVDTTIEVECPECREVQDVDLPFDSAFFLPGKERTARRKARSASSPT
jgi:hypothetical protein